MQPTIYIRESRSHQRPQKSPFAKHKNPRDQHVLALRTKIHPIFLQYLTLDFHKFFSAKDDTSIVSGLVFASTRESRKGSCRISNGREKKKKKVRPSSRHISQGSIVEVRVGTPGPRRKARISGNIVTGVSASTMVWAYCR